MTAQASPEQPRPNARDRERWLRERVDAAIVIGRWKSTTKEQLLRMLADALLQPGPLQTSCTCPDLAAGRRDRNCPYHGIVAEDDSRDVTPHAELDFTEEFEIEDRVICVRGYLAQIHRLGGGKAQVTKAEILDLLERLLTPPEPYEWINED